ncbi:MAG: hypothetical protein RLQ12_24890 [Cyclobacteriaceae bacterium]
MQLLLLFLPFSLLFHNPESLEGDREILLNKIFEAVGGKENWESIQTRIDYYKEVRSTKKFNSTDPFYEETSGIKLYKAIGDSIYMDRLLKISSNKLDTFASCYNGEIFFTQNSGSRPFKMEGFASYNKFVNCGYPSSMLRADSILLPTQKQIENSGYDPSIAYDILEVYWGRTGEAYYFSRSTNLLVKSHRIDKPLIITFYYDYKEIQGRFVPLVKETYENQKFILSIELKEVIFDKPLDDTLFKYNIESAYILNAKI